MVARANTVLCDGAKVRQARHLNGWTQEELAEKAGVPKSSVERMEREKPIYVTTLSVVAQTLNVQIKDLLLTDETGPQKESRPEGDLQEIEHNLKEKLRTEAMSHLAKKLHNRKRDYQPLIMEMGSVPDRQARGPNLPYRESQPPPEDHNRSWKDFASDQLLRLQGPYVLSSDTGTGKTTILRYLQLKILEQGEFLPIFVHASRLEGLKFQDVEGVISHLIELLEIDLPKTQVTTYLKTHFGKVKLLVDGLDQIGGVGTDYGDLLAKLLGIFHQNLIVAARPFAVISYEDVADVKFLRLKPFDTGAQRKFFGKHYSRACDVCESCRELMGIPMLAHMVRTLIERKQDEGIKNRVGLYEQFTRYILRPLTGYKHEKLRSDIDVDTRVYHALAEISYEALVNNYKQKIPVEFCEPLTRSRRTTIERLLKHGLVKLVIDRSPGIGEFSYFSHQSFQEYLAAKWATQEGRRIAYILDRMWDPKWKEVIKFLAGLTGEDFVKRIYSPGCKDNCIHSRLFLAAGCYGEVSRVSKLERLILRKLKDLLRQTAFRKDAIWALSRLNDEAATHFLIQAATNRTKFKSENLKKELCSLAWEVLPSIRHRLPPKHFDLLFQAIVEDETSANFGRAILSSLADALTPEQIDRIIDIDCISGGDDRIPVGDILYESSSSRAQFKRIFEYLRTGNERSKRRALEILFIMFRGHWPLTQRPVHVVEADSLQEIQPVTAYDGGIQFTTGDVDTLMRYAETPKCDRLEATFVMTMLAEQGVLSPQHINWIIEMPRWAGKDCSDAIAHALFNFYPVLSRSHVQRILILLQKSRPAVQKTYLQILTNVPDKLSKNDIQKIVPFLDSKDPNLRLLSLRILERLHSCLTPGLISQVIELVRTIGKNPSPRSGTSLQVIFSILMHVKNKLSPGQIQRIIGNISETKCDCDYLTILGNAESDYGKSSGFLPKKLPTNLIDEICVWVRQPLAYKRKLGAAILATMGNSLPRKAIGEILHLLSDPDDTVVFTALRALSCLCDRLTSKDISRIIGYLDDKTLAQRVSISEYQDPQHFTLYHAIGNCLITAKNSLSEQHVTQLEHLVRSGQSMAATQALSVLTQIPDRMSKECLPDIVRMLEREVLPVDPALRPISAFCSSFSDREIKQIVGYLRDPRGYVRMRAVSLLQYLRPTSAAVEEVIGWLLDANFYVRDEASEFLRVHCSMLTEKDVDRIISAYVQNSGGSYLAETICRIPPLFLTKHVPAVVKLLGKNDPDTQCDTLNILTHIGEGFTPDDIARLKGLLKCETERAYEAGRVCEASHDTLKSLYSSGFLNRIS